MKLTLRAAHKLAEKITQYANTIHVSPLVSINTYSVELSNVRIENDVFSQFDDQQSVFAKNVSAFVQLISARNDIRNMIRVANFEAIDGLISDRKQALDMISVYKKVVGVSEARNGLINSGEALNRKVRATLERKNERIYDSDHVNYSVLTDESAQKMEELISQYQRKVEKLDDQLLTANTTTFITLPAEIVDLLEQHKLV